MRKLTRCERLAAFTPPFSYLLATFRSQVGRQGSHKIYEETCGTHFGEQGASLVSLLRHDQLVVTRLQIRQPKDVVAMGHGLAVGLWGGFGLSTCSWPLSPTKWTMVAHVLGE